MLKQKKFSNTSQCHTRIFITEINDKIDSIRFFRSKYNNNIFQYQIVHVSLQDFVSMDRSACRKDVLKRT